MASLHKTIGKGDVCIVTKESVPGFNDESGANLPTFVGKDTKLQYTGEVHQLYMRFSIIDPSPEGITYIDIRSGDVSFYLSQSE